MRLSWCLTWMVALAMLATTGCRAMTPPPPDCPGDPDEKVMELVDAWQRAPCKGLYEGNACGGCDGNVRSKEFIRRQTENLIFRYPRHTPARFLAALMAYEANDSARAVEHLDTALALDPVHPEAVALRSRIALEEGNVQYAKRLLQDQIALVPNDASLHEVMSSAYYMSEEYDVALRELDTSERLGGDRGRIAYNRGIIYEAKGEPQIAAGHFKTATTAAPYWPRPKGRLEALEKGEITDAQAVAYPPVEQR